jgi:ketosteroid isomerase-like protein
MTHLAMHEIAQTLAEYCRNGQEAKGLAELYHADAVSVEAFAQPEGGNRETHGVEGIRGKHAWWNSAFEVHEAHVDGPYPHGDDRFALIFELDATFRQSGEKSHMKEIGLYTVKDGKIVREEFYYPMG